MGRFILTIVLILMTQKGKNMKNNTAVRLEVSNKEDVKCVKVPILGQNKGRIIQVRCGAIKSFQSAG
jgi:hypothetical protein